MSQNTKFAARPAPTKEAASSAGNAPPWTPLSGRGAPAAWGKRMSATPAARAHSVGMKTIDARPPAVAAAQPAHHNWRD